MSNPYFITGPALISFSGGRRSAYMLKQIIDAHGGTLPADVHVCFANTGKEREETLRFVHECGVRWGIHITWLEFTDYPAKAPIQDRFAEVGFNSASRDGEPFSALIRRKKYLPNAVTRFCTTELKVRVMKHFMLSLGYERWTNVVGLRADEMRRVSRAFDANEKGKERWKSVMPLAKAGARKGTVLQFWFGKPQIDLTIPANDLPHGFDLGLEDYEGNCDLCMLKAKARKLALIRKMPELATWWIGEEAGVPSNQSGARFVTEYSYADLVDQVASSPLLPLEPGDDFEHDAECGVGGVDYAIRCGRRDAA